MKKILSIGLVSLVAVSFMASSAFAFGNCAGKPHTTKVTDTTKTDTTKEVKDSS